MAVNSKIFFYAFLLAGIVNFVVVTPSSARYFDGSRLKDLVDTDDMVEAKTDNYSDIWGSGALFGYVVGVYEGVEDILVCTPENVKPGQLVGIVKKFVKNNPEMWNMPANQIVVMALSQAFPCPNVRKSKQSPRR